MALSEHLSIHLHLAYKEGAITRATQSDSESHENVLWRVILAVPHILKTRLKQVTEGRKRRRKDYLSNKRKAFNLKE